MYIPYMDGMGCIYAQVPTNKSHTHTKQFSLRGTIYFPYIGTAKMNMI